MITLAASIIGFGSSIIPEIIKIIKLQKDNDYKISLLEKEIEIKKINADAELYKQNIQNSDVKNFGHVDKLNSTVRPMLAYGFFIIYIVIKYLQFKTFNSSGLIHASELLWGSDDQATFTSITSFYFGQRTFNNKTKK